MSDETKTTAREQLLDELGDLYAEGVFTVKSRGKKYANESDPFQNFREAAAFAGVSVERGFLVRIGDKFSRLKNILEAEEAGTEVEEFTDESEHDTLLDAINYIGLLNIYRAWKNKYVEGYAYSGAPEDYPEEDEVMLIPEEPVEQDPVPTFSPMGIPNDVTPLPDSPKEPSEAVKRLRSLFGLKKN